VVPVWQLRWGLTSLNWFLPLILFIVIGSMTVGAVFVAAAVAGDDVRWQIAPGRLALYKRSWLRERTELITSGDVRRTSVEVETWDSDPDTYRVCLELWNGERHQTPDFATRRRRSLPSRRSGTFSVCHGTAATRRHFDTVFDST